MESTDYVKSISGDKNDQQILLKIAEAIRNIKYGYVQLTIQDGKVIQIDKTEKFRLDKQKSKKKGGNG